MSSNRLKPKVGIVFSQTDKFSGESLNLASYFCGLLSSSGYSEIYMIGYQSDGMPGEVYPRRIKYIPRGETTPKEVPVSLHKTRNDTYFSLSHRSFLDRYQTSPSLISTLFWTAT